MADSTFNSARYLDCLATARHEGQISEAAASNISRWLTQHEYQTYWPKIADHIRAHEWDTLEDVFWTSIPFGTAGRRGRMYPIGCNAINERTVGETVQALAAYLLEIYEGPQPATCAIAYDTRHRSEEFARLSAEIMVAAGFEVEYFDGFRSTPLLAATVRYKSCACGVMISASHNPPTDNAVKVLWSTGGQLTTPHDDEVTKRLANVTELRRESFDAAVAAGRIRYVAEEMDAVYQEAVLAEGFGLGRGARDLSIIYSPLHGVGLTSVMPVLQSDGFELVEVFTPHAAPDGCFPNVPDNIANPENPAVFDAIIQRARETGADLILASDPDADRLGCASPVRLGSQAWTTINGHQIAVLLTDYVLRMRQANGTLAADNFIVKTLVTTDMLRVVADSYGIRTEGECLSGFKWIGSLIDDRGASKFVLGAEEAHGYLIGTHVRDKDGAVAAMLLAESAAAAKAAGRSIYEELQLLYKQHGLHQERTLAKQMPGADGTREMQEIMSRLRRRPLANIGGLPVARQRDYRDGTVTHVPSGDRRAMDGPRGNLIVIETELPGNYVAVRPSGTEPKIKFYLFTALPRDRSQDLESATAELEGRLDALQRSLLESL